MLFFENNAFFTFIKSSIVVITCSLAISSCTIEKQYHSRGWKINSNLSIRDNANKKSPITLNNPTTKTKFSGNNSQARSFLSVNGVLKNANTPHQATLISQQESKSNHWFSEKYFPKNENVNGILKPQDTVFFPEKYHHRKHGTLYLPQIKNQEEFNSATAFANSKDVSAWNWFDRGHISAKIALYWLFALMAMIIIIGLGNISLAGIASTTRKSITTVLILVPAILFAIGYLCYLLGTFSIWRANKLYKNALYKLPYDLKLKADAIIMHARIPYVSKGATLRHAKRILNTYPNDRNGEWLEDVSKTKREIETGRTSLTINNWSRMRAVGFITTLFIVAFLAIRFL